MPLEDVVELAQKGNKDAMIHLLTELKPFVRSKVRNYFFAGSDEEDVIQEGMIGLLSAIQDYKREKSSFKSFATLCIKRRVISAIKSANRQKNIPLNAYFSIHGTGWQEENGRILGETIESTTAVDPERIVAEKEEALNTVRLILKTLTPMEKKVLIYYMMMDSYDDIAKEIGCRVKSVDNALQRIKRKAEKVMISLSKEE